jgi:hypothetical protein
MASAAISEPFPLGSYSTAKKLKQHQGSTCAYATYDGSGKEGCATVAVQGSGVHILDVRTVPISIESLYMFKDRYLRYMK